jgi:hypothetical protein
MADVGSAAGCANDPLWDDWEAPPRLTASPVLHLEGFDGPLDVLLDLAERQRIDFGRMSILELAEQFVAAMARLADRVTLEQRADWLVLATRLVLLRSRLLFPDSPGSAAAAEQDAAAELRRLDDLAAMRPLGSGCTFLLRASHSDCLHHHCVGSQCGRRGERNHWPLRAR